MICYDRIDTSEGIDVNKTSESKECNIFYYWYFLNKGFHFQPNFYNRCHDFLIMSMNLIHTAILNINSNDYHCVISKISNSKAIHSIQNTALTIKNGKL